MDIAIYRGASVHLVKKVSEGSSISKQLNGQDVLKISFDSPEEIDLMIGDYIILYNNRYTLNILPTAKKSGNRQFNYDCIFEGRTYELGKVIYMDGVNGEFYLTGDLAFFVNLVVSNMNRAQSGWSAGTIKSSQAKTLQFSNENCLTVIRRLCTEFECDLRITDSKEITVDSFGQNQIFSFAYGKGKGLYSLTRNVVDSKNVFTRLYPFGGTRNIPANYRNYSTRLKIAAGYIDKNTANYGIIETSKTFEEIYPRFKGAITWVKSDDVLVFRCSSVDFDLNTQLISGLSAKIHFNTGDLSGYEFELVSYNNTAKEFTLKLAEQEKVMNNSGTLDKFLLPNSVLKPGVGNEFVILDITMPQAYIDAAEVELLTAAQEYLDQNCDPRVGYTLDIDPKYMKDNLISLAIGDYLRIVDISLNIDKYIRIVGTEQSVWYENEWKATLTDHLAPSLQNRMYSDVEEIKRLIVINKLNDTSRARRSWRNVNELKDMIFDPDDYFDTTNIKPGSISTEMINIGVTSQQFTLSCLIEPMYQASKSQVKFGAGQLVHFSIEETPRTWTMSENIVTGLLDGTAYYLYAKCIRATTNTGQVICDSVQRKWDSDPTYYHFLIGVLHSVVDSIRGISLTYGQTSINGRYIKTGRIQNGDGSTYIDLDNGDIRGKFTFRSGNTDAQVESDLVSAQSDADAAFTTAGAAYQTAYDASQTAGTANNTANNAAAAASNALNVANAKRRNFTAQPTVPYEVGDIWQDGVDLWTCVATRLTGNYTGSDWAKRVNYDSTQATIDGGLITAGSLRLKDGNNVEWAGMRGATGADGTEIAIWAGASFDNRGSAPFYVRHNGQIFATAGSIAGWSLLSNAFTKDTGYPETSAGMSPGDYPFYAGATHGNRQFAPFRVQPNGSVYIRALDLRSSPSGRSVQISSADNNMKFYNSANQVMMTVGDPWGADRPGVLANYNSDRNYSSQMQAGYFLVTNNYNSLASITANTNSLTVFLKGLRDLDDDANAYLMYNKATGEVGYWNK